MGEASREIGLMFCFMFSGMILVSPSPLWVKIPLFFELLILGTHLLILNKYVLLGEK